MVWELTALVAGAISIIAAVFLYRWVMAQANENKAMAEFSEAIQDGAAAYLRRLFQALAGLAFVVAIIIFFSLGWEDAFAHLLGAGCSAAAAYTACMLRPEQMRESLGRRGLHYPSFFPSAFRGRSYQLSVVGLALLGMTVLA